LSCVRRLKKIEDENKLEALSADSSHTCGSAAFIASTSFKVHAALPACGMQVLRGGYGAGTTGLINTDPNSTQIGAFVPFAEAARFDFERQGNVHGSSSVDFGNFVSPVTFTGTYTVKANCTGNLTINAGAHGIVHRDLVIVSGGSEVDFVSTDPGSVIAGSMKKQNIDGH
jgi:hypothetical protein